MTDLKIIDRIMENILSFGDAPYRFIYLALICISFIFIVFSVIKSFLRKWECVYFIFLSSAVLLWAFFSWSIISADADLTVQRHTAFRFCAVILIPALIYMHIRQQVSYREVHIFSSILMFFVPFFLILVIVRDLFYPQLFGFLPPSSVWAVYYYIFIVYALFMLVRSYLLCLNVFYQMPYRTRRSTGYMLLAISCMTVIIVIDYILTRGSAAEQVQGVGADAFTWLLDPLLYTVMLSLLFGSLWILPASDIIVTSRKFVVGGLITTILVLNRNMEILDWNRSEWKNGFPLPTPRYREKIEVYRQRIFKQTGCRVSPHSENIIIFTAEEKEIYFFFQTHKIGNAKRDFGSIVEISEVTAVYALTRYFEDIAHFDALTGLHNRNAYLDFVSNKVTGEHMPLLIIVGDVNRLKQVNDLHGHIRGDMLIKAVSEIIRKSAPETGFVSRIGGDEFSIIVPNSDAKTALDFIKKAEDACAEMSDEVFDSPSVSWGYAIMESDYESYNEAFSKADAMMYEHKKARHRFRSSGLLPEDEDVRK